MYEYRDYFKANVYTIWVHGPSREDSDSEPNLTRLIFKQDTAATAVAIICENLSCQREKVVIVLKHRLCSYMASICSQQMLIPMHRGSGSQVAHAASYMQS